MTDNLEPTDAPAPAPLQVEEPQPSSTGPDMSVMEHLEELRWRIVKSAAAFTVAALAVFSFNQPIIHFLERPLHREDNPFQAGPPNDVQLIFTSPTEYFVAVIKVALLGGLYLALPVILYQIMAFVSPGLLPKERRWAIPTVVGAFVFFTIGMVFSYYMLLPTGLGFLVGFAPPDVKPMLSVGRYLSFAAGLVFATGLAFQLPLFLLGASVAGVVTSYFLARYRRQAFLLAFVLAAIITPSIDIMTQALLAGALYMLFEISIFLIRLTGK